MTTTFKVPPQRLRHVRAAARPHKALYWAYGSNLNISQMISRCPKADPVGPLSLLHMSMVFRGVADVTIHRDAEALGGLWEVTASDERALDSYEGIYSRVYLKRFFTAQVDGVLTDVLFYQMAASRGVMPPSEAYLETITRGYRDFGLDERFLRQSLQESWGSKDVTPNLRARHDRRGRPRLARSMPRITEEFALTEAELAEAGAV